MDTIKIIIPSEKIPDRKELLKKLDLITGNKSIRENEKEEKSFFGTLKNLKFNLVKGGLIVEGSFSKYRLGSNQFNLSPKELKKAMSVLTGLFGLPFEDAKVLRLDIPGNIIPKQSEKDYYTSLGSLDNYNRHTQKNGLNYQSNSSTGKTYISIYEKLEKVRSKEIVTEILKSRNVLRYEYRFQSQSDLVKCLGIKPVTVKDIYENYDKLIQRWVDMFLAIKKHYELPDLSYEVFEIKGEFDRQMRIKGVQAMGGIESIVDIVKKAQRHNLLSHPNVASNLIKRYEKLMDSPDRSVISSLATELEDKVKIMGHLAIIERIEDEILETL